MRLSYKWLQEYVDLSDITPQQLADRLTTAGLEVEGIEPMAQGTGLVIAEVIECDQVQFYLELPFKQNHFMGLNQMVCFAHYVS